MKARYLSSVLGLLSCAAMAAAAEVNTSQLSENGWYSDDTRADGSGVETAGTNLINVGYTDDPEGSAGPYTTLSDLLEQIMLGPAPAGLNGVPAGTHLGACQLFIDAIGGAGGKSQISHRKDDGSGHAAGSVLNDPAFFVDYTWMGDGPTTFSCSFKIGFKTSEFGLCGTSSRTGENVWDKLLIFEPNHSGVNNHPSDGNWYAEHVTRTDGTWWIFDRTLGYGGQPQYTLADMQTSTDLYGGHPKTIADIYALCAAGHITSVQFGIGSANAGASVYVNQLETSFYRPGDVTTFGPGPGVENLDTGEEFFTIQAAIDDADTADGHTLAVAPGTYTENIDVTKRVNILGAGSGDDPLIDTIIQKDANATVMRLSASGLSAGDPLLLQDLRIVADGQYGLEVHNGQNVQYLKWDNVHVVGPPTQTIENEVGFKVATDASVSDLEVVDCAFDGCDYGWYFAKHGDWGPGGSMVANVAVTNTSVCNNSFKGFYIEKLSDATFNNCQFNDNGSSPFWNSDWNGGVDINLKGEEIYQNIAFNNCDVMRNGLGYKEGAGLMIKARSDGSTYGAHPATLTGVTITGCVVAGNERGIRFGEPTKDNPSPTDITVSMCTIVSNYPQYGGGDGSEYGGLVNQLAPGTLIDAEDNWWGSVDGPWDPVGTYEVSAGDCADVGLMINVAPAPGEAVSDGDVDYCPWATSAADLSLVTTDDCLDTGDTLTVTLTVSNAVDYVVGGQFALSYDTDVLSFTGATALAPFIELYEVPGTGTIDYAVQLPSGDPGLIGNLQLAQITFTVVGETCPATGLVDFRANPQPTQLSNEFGDAIVPTLTELNAVSVDETAPVFSGGPGNGSTIFVNADAGFCTAVVSWTEPTANDNCDGAVTPTVDLPPGTEFGYGPTLVTYTATDTCGNISYYSFTIDVSDSNELALTLELQPNIDTGNPLPDTLSRCVTIELRDCAGATASVSMVVTFDVTAVPSSPNLAVGTATVLVPCDFYECITVQDTLHTLRRTLDAGAGFGIVDTQYVADFATAGKPLLGGNYKDDAWVDILDFGVFTGQYGVNYGTGDTTCATPFPHPDSSGDGIVGDEDFTFIQINFWLGHEDDCCTPGDFNGGGGRDPAAFGKAGPVTRISVAELRKLGLHDLLKGDLNNDGWLDVNDMQAFMGGIRP